MDSSELATLGVLGVLAETETATVDEIRSHLQHNFGRYWAGSYGVLLPALSRLTDEDADPAVERLTADSDVVYTLTDRGTERLRELLRTPVEDVANPLSYPQLVLKLGFLHLLSEDDQRAELADLEDRFEQARNRFLELGEIHDDGVEDRRGYRRELFSLRAMVLDDHLQWVRSLRDSITTPADA